MKSINYNFENQNSTSDIVKSIDYDVDRNYIISKYFKYKMKYLNLKN